MPWSEEIENEFVGQERWNAVYTVQLGELADNGVFSWDSEYFDWKDAAYSDEQYNRFCQYFYDRFEYREISMLPYKQWAKRLNYMLKYELMPKYKPLYLAVEDANPLAESDEYYKSRHIESDYPETLLSENADYISRGQDDEYERIKLGNITDMQQAYVEGFRSVDAAICDELEVLFISMYTVNANAF